MEHRMIVSIGEIVWDIFGNKKILGGAPLNVAYHLSCLNHDVHLISKIGTDDLASVTLQRIQELSLPTEGIQQDPKLPTGQVVVTLGPDNEPSFDIVAPAAWDAIEHPAPQSMPATPFHLVYGTLAQRSEKSKSTIRSLWEKAAMTFYDVNLRPPFTPPEIVLESLPASDVVKLNDHELRTVAGWKNLPSGTVRELAQSLFSVLSIQVLAVTLGNNGALLICQDGLFEHPGFLVQVADTVGAGDAFFASLIEGIIQKRSWQQCLEQANRRGSIVASKAGATPLMDEK